MGWNGGLKSVAYVVGWLMLTAVAVPAAVALPPTIGVPGNQTTPVATPLVFSASGGNALTVTDPDVGAGAVQLALFATNGTLSLARTTGLTFTPGHGDNGPNPICSGSLGDLNRALDGLTFTPRARFGGLALVSLTANDLGHAGAGAALQSTNTVRVWVASQGDSLLFVGENDGWNQGDVPPGLDHVVQVSSHANHTLALRNDGTVVGFGRNDFAWQVAPEWLSGVVQVAAGWLHSVALKSDGTVVTWPTGSVHDVPAGLTDVVSIGACNESTVAVRRDGTVVAWGLNESGETVVPAVFSDPGTARTVAVAGGGAFFMALSNDGTLSGWGSNWGGQLNVPADLGPVTTLATGVNTTLAVSGGRVTGWGWSFAGIWPAPASVANVVQLAAGDLHAIALQEDGSVVAWGLDDLGQTELPAGMTTPVAVGAGGNWTVIVAETANVPPVVHTPGDQTTARDMPLTLSTQSANVFSVTDGPDNSSGPVEARLYASHGTLQLTRTDFLRFSPGHANGTCNPVVAARLYDLNQSLDGLTFTPQPGFAGLATISLSVDDRGHAGTGGAFTTTATVRVWVSGPGNHVAAWGTNTSGQCNTPVGLANAVAVAAGSYHSAAVTNDGRVVAWGDNTGGQLAVNGTTGALAVAAGQFDTLVLKQDGSLFERGSSGRGEGDIPAAATGIVQVACGNTHLLALRGDGTVVAWGSNGTGEATVPDGLRDVVAVAARAGHSLALKSDGTVVAWGSNWGGEGVVPDGLHDVVAIACGANFSVAQLVDGSLVAWGFTYYADIHATGGASGALAFGAGDYHALAVLPDGSVTTWGTNFDDDTIVPPGLSNAFAVAGGASHSLAIGDLTGAPRINVPGVQYVWGDTALPFSAAGGNAVSVDVPGLGDAPLQACLFGTNGRLTLGTTAGLTFAPGHENGGYNPIVTGTLADLNTALDTLAFRTGSGYGGLALVSLSVTANGKSATNTVRIMVGTNGHTVVGWGLNTSGQTKTPDKLNNVIQVAAGRRHTVALLGNNTVKCWGSNDAGETKNPSFYGGIWAVYAADYHSFALSANGQLSGWGDNSFGQTQPPFSLNNVVQVAAGYSHTLALRADGTVVAFGSNTYGESTVPAGLQNVAGVAAGRGCSLAIKADGTIVTWGHRNGVQPMGLSNVIAASGSYYHFVALLGNGQVVAWGSNTQGESTVPAAATGALQVTAGYQGSAALKPDGTVVYWGTNACGEANLPAMKGAVGLAEGLSHLEALAYAPVTDLALAPTTIADGAPVGTPLSHLTTADPNPYASWTYQLVSGSGSRDNSQFAISGDQLVAGVVVDAKVKATYYIRVRTTDNYGMSFEKAFQLSFYHPNLGPSVVAPSDVQTPQDTPLLFGGANRVSVSDPDVGALSLKLYLFATNGTVRLGTASGLSYSSGHPNGGANPIVVAPAAKLNTVLGSLTFTPRPRFTGLATLQVMVDDQGHNGHGPALQAVATVRVQVTSAGGGVVAWGRAAEGQSTVPDGLSGVVSVSAGLSHSLALKADGSVVAWGDNSAGQTGAGPSGALAVSAGGSHNLAVGAGGSLVTWGSSLWGLSAIPSTATNVVAVAAGGYHSLALRSDGQVEGWGQNLYHQASPPAGLNHVAAIAAGWRHSLALRNDGTVVAWGSNVSGESTVPAGLANVVAIAAGAYYSLALQSDGTVVGWGDASKGALAQGNGPLQLGAGQAHSVALRGDYTVAVAGNNGNGQRNVPVGLPEVWQVAAGGYHSLALVSPARAAAATVTLTTSPVSPQPVGTSVTLVATLKSPVAGAQYQFLASSDGGRTQTVVRDWASANTAPWRPATAGSYVLTVNVKGGGSATATFVVNGS